MKKFFCIFSVISVLAIIITVPLLCYGKTAKDKGFPYHSPKYKCILRLWHIDTFEGGKGSRGDFLNGVATDWNNDGVIIMVTVHTKESAKTSMAKGETPDMISYGVGVSELLKNVVRLQSNGFSGGETGGNTYALPWCVGSYYSIRKSGDNQPISKLILSQNDYNTPNIACKTLYPNEDFTVEKKPPIEAYSSFLSSKGGVALVGTQRDIIRLEKRKVGYTAERITEYSDIVQYISVCSSDDEKAEYSKKFIDRLLSEEVQTKLSEIGMFSYKYGVEGVNEDIKCDFSSVKYTVSPFTDDENLKRIQNLLLKDFTIEDIKENKIGLKRL